MSRYIEVSKAMELCNEFYFSEETCSVKGLFDSAPSIDIVRCGECKWAKANGTYKWCGRLDSTARITADDFCSYGERSEKPNNSMERSSE